MSDLENTLMEGPETIICNAIMALWQRGLFEAAYAPIRFLPVTPITFKTITVEIDGFGDNHPYWISSRNRELQSQFPDNVWVVFKRSSVADDIKRILDVRKALIETLKLAENDLREKFEEVASAKAQ